MKLRTLVATKSNGLSLINKQKTKRTRLLPIRDCVLKCACIQCNDGRLSLIHNFSFCFLQIHLLSILYQLNFVRLPISPTLSHPSKYHSTNVVFRLLVRNSHRPFTQILAMNVMRLDFILYTSCIKRK